MTADIVQLAREAIEAIADQMRRLARSPDIIDRYGEVCADLNRYHTREPLLAAEVVRLTEQLAHLQEQAGEDSCADFIAKANADRDQLKAELEAQLAAMTAEFQEARNDARDACASRREMADQLAAMTSECEKLRAVVATQSDELVHYASEAGFAKGRLYAVTQALKEACDALESTSDRAYCADVARQLRAVGLEGDDVSKCVLTDK